MTGRLSGTWSGFSRARGACEGGSCDIELRYRAHRAAVLPRASPGARGRRCKLASDGADAFGAAAWYRPLRGRPLWHFGVRLSRAACIAVALRAACACHCSGADSCVPLSRAASVLLLLWLTAACESRAAGSGTSCCEYRYIEAMTLREWPTARRLHPQTLVLQISAPAVVTSAHGHDGIQPRTARTGTDANSRRHGRS